MNGAMQVWTLFFGAATLFLILVQIAILGGMLWAFLRLRAAAKKYRGFLEAEGVEPRQLIVESYRALKAAEAAAVKAAKAPETADEMISEVRERIHRIEGSMDRVVHSIEHTRDSIQHNLAAPFQEYRAVSAAVRTALNVLRHP